MSDSVLGEDLEIERQKVLFRKIGEIMIRKNEISRQADLGFLDTLAKQIRGCSGTFQPNAEQFERVRRIYEHLQGLTEGSNISPETVREMIEDGREIRKENSLTPGRMLNLNDIVDRYVTGSLSQGDIRMLQFLVLEGLDRRNGDD